MFILVQCKGPSPDWNAPSRADKFSANGILGLLSRVSHLSSGRRNHQPSDMAYGSKTDSFPIEWNRFEDDTLTTFSNVLHPPPKSLTVIQSPRFRLVLQV